MKTKMLEVTMEDGRTFHVPLKLIAESRAKYYSEVDPDPTPEATYKAEFDYTMEDADEAIDWYQNNMNPSDVAHSAVMVADHTVPSFEDAIPEELNVIEVDQA